MREVDLNPGSPHTRHQAMQLTYKALDKKIMIIDECCMCKNNKKSIEHLSACRKQVGKKRIVELLIVLL